MCTLYTKYTLWNWDDVNRHFADFACVENEKGLCLLSSARKADQLQQERTCGQDSLVFYILRVSRFVPEVQNTELGWENLWMNNDAIKTWLTLRRQIPVKFVKPFWVLESQGHVDIEWNKYLTCWHLVLSM